MLYGESAKEKNKAVNEDRGSELGFLFLNMMIRGNLFEKSTPEQRLYIKRWRSESRGYMGEEHAGHEGSNCKHPDVKEHLAKSEEEQDAQ